MKHFLKKQIIFLPVLTVYIPGTVSFLLIWIPNLQNGNPS